MAITSIRCNSASEAADILAANPGAKLLAGGTLVMRAVNEGDQSFNTVVRIVDPALSQIQVSGDRASIGSAVTMAALAANRDSAYLADVARSVGGPAVRNMATVGGNLCAPGPYGDLAVALLALDAELEFADGGTQTLDDFLQARDNATARVITRVSVLRPSSGDEFRFHKVSRVKPKGVSVICIAAWLPFNGNTLLQPRVAYGGMANTSVRVHAVEAALAGRPLDAASIEAATKVATDGLNPPTDPLASNWYRLSVAPVHLRRVLQGTTVEP